MTHPYRTGQITIYRDRFGRIHYVSTLNGIALMHEQCRLTATWAQAVAWAEEYIDKALA